MARRGEEGGKSRKVVSAWELNKDRTEDLGKDKKG